MELVIILLFVIINGFFSMAEISVISSRKSKLESEIKKGSKTAQSVLNIIENPDKFLSTIQIAITAIGLIIGLYTGEQYKEYLTNIFVKLHIEESFAIILSRIVIVVFTTFIMLVLGELLPKRIGMSNPEKIAEFIIRPMKFLSKIAFPFVWLLSKTTSFLASLLGLKTSKEQNATEEEIKSIIDHSADAGEIDENEQEIVNRVLDLNDRNIVSFMAPRADLVWFEQDEYISDVVENLGQRVYYIYPVVKDNLDNIVGVIYIKDILKSINKGLKVNDLMREPNFIHESVGVYDVLESFKMSKIHYAFIIDEYGFVQGMITMTDILESIVDNPAQMDEIDDEQVFVQREDGNYLVDGQYPFYDFLSHFGLEDKYQTSSYNTVSGLILAKTGKVPRIGEKIEWEQFIFEIVDIDGLRIDRVLVSDNKEEKQVINEK
ncbi:MAG: HlyC/CorC family transporter [Bacteroidales bacterium]|nr:HlyC/CorC family transporter [Bacteroidales bacterium]